MPDLRPMEFGEILDGALTLFRRNFALFVKLSVAVMWAPVAVLVYIQMHFLSGLSQAAAAKGSEAILAAWQDQFAPMILWFLLWGVLYSAATLLLTAGTIRVISDNYLGREPSFEDAFSQGAGKILPLFLVGLGKGILIVIVAFIAAIFISVVGVGLGKVLGGVGAFFLILASVVGAFWFVFFVVCGYAVTTPIVVLETLSSSFDAFGRSWDLTRNAKLRMFGLGAVAILLVSILPSLVLQAVGYMVKEMAPNLVFTWFLVQSVLPIMLIPIMPCILTLAYYDLRVRREAFDLQLLGRELGLG